VGLALQEDGDVFTGNFEAGGFLEGGCIGLMGVFSSMEAKPKNSP
jgi:hypothetical protein